MHHDDSVGGLYYTVRYARQGDASSGGSEAARDFAMIEAQTTATRLRRRGDSASPVDTAAPPAAAAPKAATGGASRAMPTSLAELNAMLAKARATGDRKESIRVPIDSSARHTL